MTNPNRFPGQRATKLLAVILVVLTLLPLAVFATNATNRGPLRAAREAALRRAGAKPEDPATRIERQRAARAKRHPTFVSVVLGMGIQLFWIAAAGAIGRRWFNLRL